MTRSFYKNAFPGQNAYEVFHRTVDPEADGTANCPVARCYKWQHFAGLCETVGFRTEYLGGYLSEVELDSMKKHLRQALSDERLPQEHRSFLASLRTDDKGLPMYQGKYAGIGGVYQLIKP